MTTGGDHVKRIEQRHILLSFGMASVALLAACGSGSDESASPSSLPFEEVTTSVTESPVTSAAIQEDTAITAPSGLTSEMFAGMLETESGRNLLVGSIAGETGLLPEEAECLLDVIPIEALLEAAESFLGGEGDEGFFPADQVDELAPLLDSCGIAADALTP